jgi:lysyl-tRNA synthetase class II
LCNVVNGTSEATFGEHKIDFKAPYKRVTMRQSIIDFTGFDIMEKLNRIIDFAKEWNRG